MFIPTTREEAQKLGWYNFDIILVSGDSYIDSPYMGIAVIGHILMDAGYKVGIIAQPDISTGDDITRLGEPNLFWGLSAGSIDSMVSNYTASLKKRKSDDYTPGGLNNRRPDRATIVYTNMVRKFFKQTKPIVLGGMEASLRRIAHYDYWSNKIRRSILFDAKADYLLYGMADRSIIEFAGAILQGNNPKSIRGLCYINKEPIQDYYQLDSYEEVSSNKIAYIDSFDTFYKNNDPLSAKGLVQAHGDRYLVQNPPAFSLNQEELDRIYALPYERAQHPYYEKNGNVKALETIRFSISTHRGCYGECNFCAIAVHEGRTIQWRSKESILNEVQALSNIPEFKGIIQDLGGPTANMYGFECRKKTTRGTCQDRRCISPEVCSALRPNHLPQIDLLKSVREHPQVRKVFVASGLRYDLIIDDRQFGNKYLEEILAHHVSGQFKIAPEHTESKILKLMGKPASEKLLEFKNRVDKLNKKLNKNQFLTYYFIAAYPGCSDKEMQQLKNFTSQKLKVNPEQVQIFTPTPSTYASVMYYTEMNPFTKEPIFVEKSIINKNRQKEILVKKTYV
ncbi:MAG: YgiQ family radical SAM protein [Chloroflexi bacterium HGW-Chloroflexi-3]|nr:MAG: YgiQ family radical SAM protein [Chloroflexi bacterium HGW-Chloroflexi-3]